MTRRGEHRKPEVVDLGWCVARMEVGRLTICSPCDGDNHVFLPAQSISLCKDEDLLALRDLLLRWYPLGTPAIEEAWRQK